MTPELRIYQDDQVPTNADFDKHNYVATDDRPGKFTPSLRTLSYSVPDGVTSPDGTWTQEYPGKKETVIKHLSSFSWMIYRRIFEQGNPKIELGGWARLTAEEANQVIEEARLGNWPEFMAESARAQIAKLLGANVIPDQAHIEPGTDTATLDAVRA
jgi:hypothetical protein